MSSVTEAPSAARRTYHPTRAYIRYELLRVFRNVRFFAFSLAFPLILFLTIAAANKDVDDFAGTGVPAPLYLMVGMASWGAMAAVIAGGARIAAERQIGWTRLLRITPLSARTYLAAKVLTGYAVAAVSIALLYAAGLSMGVSLPGDAWIRMTVLILVGLVPFAALGIWFGHVLGIESMGPALGGVTSMLAFLGGAWGPVGDPDGWLRQLCELLPSTWLVAAGQSALSGEWWPAKGWIVIAVWTAVLTWLATRAYRRDTGRA